MSLAFNLQKPSIIFVLLLIHLSLARAMRIYPTYAPPAASPQQQQNQDTNGDDRARQQRSIAVAAMQATNDVASHYRQRDHWQGIGRKTDQSLDPPHSDATSPISVDCHGSALSSSSSHKPGCSKSPAPEEAEGSEIDPRYGVEKRLVPTGPNPLHN